MQAKRAEPQPFCLFFFEGEPIDRKVWEYGLISTQCEDEEKSPADTDDSATGDDLE